MVHVKVLHYEVGGSWEWEVEADLRLTFQLVAAAGARDSARAPPQGSATLPIPTWQHRQYVKGLLRQHSVVRIAGVTLEWEPFLQMWAHQPDLVRAARARPGRALAEA